MADEWTLSQGAPAIFWSLVLQFTWLLVGSFPEHINIWTGVSMVLAAGYCAWQTATELSPDRTFNEIYIRYILIGTSYALAVAYKNPGTQVRIFAMLASSITLKLVHLYQTQSSKLVERPGFGFPQLYHWRITSKIAVHYLTYLYN